MDYRSFGWSALLQGGQSEGIQKSGGITHRRLRSKDLSRQMFHRIPPAAASRISSNEGVAFAGLYFAHPRHRSTALCQLAMSASRASASAVG